MRAWQFNGANQPLTRVDTEKPLAGPNEVRIQVAACGVNPIDKILMSGLYPVFPTPHTPGCEIVGTVESRGTGVHHIEVGQRVAVACRAFCGVCRFCLKGDEVGCVRGGIIGAVTNGGYADMAVVPAHNLLVLPDAMSFEDAACLTMSTPVVWHMMLQRARVGPGDRVVIFAASGGVGSAAVQTARQAGAFVVAVAGQGKADAVLALGAHVVVEREDRNLVEKIKAATDGGADVVCNPVGAAVWDQSLAVLAPGGRWTTCGVLTGQDVSLGLRKFYNSQHSLIGSSGALRLDLRHVLDAAAQGTLKPLLWKSFPFDEVPQALEELNARERIGKIIVKI